VKLSFTAPLKTVFHALNFTGLENPKPSRRKTKQTSRNKKTPERLLSDTANEGNFQKRKSLQK